MESQYQKEINEYLKNGGTITENNSGVTGADDMVEGKLLQESVTTVKDLEPHEVTAISWTQAMAETIGEDDDNQYWTQLNRTLDNYIKKNNVPVLPSSRIFWLDNIQSVCYYYSIVNESMMNPSERDYETKWDEEIQNDYKL